MNDWISVEDRLPWVTSNVLVFCSSGHRTVSFFILDRHEAANYHNGGGYSRKRSNKQSCHFDIAHSYSYTVTHWMPLPPPPKGIK